MEKEINLNSEEVLDYLKENVEEYDILEISYNRIYAPGEVLNMEIVEGEGIESFEITMQLNGELLSDTVQIDLIELKDDIIEIRHVKGEKVTIIVVDS